MSEAEKGLPSRVRADSLFFTCLMRSSSSLTAVRSRVRAWCCIRFIASMKALVRSCPTICSGSSVSRSSRGVGGSMEASAPTFILRAAS
ncbi:hypothetical protein D9M69_648090 [compost metagenome]